MLEGLSANSFYNMLEDGAKYHDRLQVLTTCILSKIDAWKHDTSLHSFEVQDGEKALVARALSGCLATWTVHRQCFVAWHAC